MAAQIPNINVVRDTPTSPNHTPLSIYTPPTPAGSAPQVDPYPREVEGLQVDANGPYPQPTTDSETQQKWWHSGGSSEKQSHQADDSGLIPTEESIRQDGRVCGLRRRVFIIIMTIVAIFVICAAVGGGVGGYYANRSSSDYADST